MSRQGNRGTAPGRTRSLLQGGGRSLTGAIRDDRIDAAENPLKLGRSTVRAFHLDLILCIPHEQFGQSSTLLAYELVYGQTVSSPSSTPRFTVEPLWKLWRSHLGKCILDYINLPGSFQKARHSSICPPRPATLRRRGSASVGSFGFRPATSSTPGCAPWPLRPKGPIVSAPPLWECSS